MLGVITALPIEGKTICSNIGYKKIHRVNDDMIVQVSGVGELNAKLAAENLLNAGASALISFGTAGGINPELSPGSLLLPELISHQTQHTVSVTPHFHKTITERLRLYFTNDPITICTDTLVHSHKIIFDRDAKSNLFQLTAATATDMESYAIGEIALQAKIPFMAIRVITDPANLNLPPFINKIFNHNGEIKYGKLLSAIATNYRQLPNLIRLQRHFIKAKFTLEKVGTFLSQGNHVIRK